MRRIVLTYGLRAGAILAAMMLVTIPFQDRIGFDYGMITSLPALGISAWRLDGDPRHWNALVSDGVRRGVLPTTRPTTRDAERLGLRRSG